jgi:predicted anti-sigma-YlaC factor YlaD
MKALKAWQWSWMTALAAVLVTSCSVRRFAVNQIGDALASGGTTFASDEDLKLVRDALPFSLKLIESLLAESPRHDGLLLAATSGFTQYAYAFVEQDADRIEEKDLAAADAMRVRARRLYLRARNYGLRGLELRHAGLEAALRKNAKEAVRVARPADVPLLFWTAASWGAAIALSKDNPDMIADQLLVEALIDRAVELDEDFERGSLHTFLISYEMARQGVSGDPAARARKHLDRAVELSQGRLAGPLVAFAEAVCVRKQERAEFEALLKRALAVDADAAPEHRLANRVAQERARWLLDRIDDLFAQAEEGN